MYSVSIYESFDVTAKSELLEITNYYFFNDHLKKLLVAVAICIVVWFIPLKVIKRLKYVIFGGTLLLVLLLFTPLAEEQLALSKGANLWLDIPGGTIQPGELFKIGYVFFISSWLVRKKKLMDDRSYFLGFVLMAGASCFVFLLLPDFGSLLVLGPVSLLLYWYAGGRPFYITITMLLGVVGIFLASLQFDYVHKRLEYFLSSTPELQNQGVGYQSHQALIAVGGGGLIGKGYGKGLQKFGYLPEAQSDFIFAAFSEEIGFLGGMILVGLYGLVVWTVLRRLPDVSDPYERMLAVGLVSLIAIQSFVNIGVNIKLLPLTGVTLPFISHGGSALIASLLEIVFLVKIIEQK